MNNLGGMGGPAGQQQMMNAGTPGGSPPASMADNKKRLNTYIYDYFLRNGMYDLARGLLKSEDIELQEKPSPNRKDVNGASDGDADSKDDIPGKPADLPKANVPSEVNSAFLLDWWAMFWDVWISGRSRGYSPTKQYLQHVQAKITNDRQRMMVNPQMQNNMAARNAMVQNGMPNDVKRAMMMQQNRPQSAAQLQMRMHMAQQGQMQREGSAMDVNGQQRPQTPGSGDNAPSPKRQRLDGGGFNGQMGPMGRGQNPGMPGQPMNPMQMQNPNAQAKMQQVYANSMRQQMQNAMDSNGQKGMPNPQGLPQGSPALDGNGEFFNANNIRSLQQSGAPNNNSNHALQDYQMQLMLLEQQNKKRLLMARQEQDATVANGTGGAMPGQQAFGAPAMSPSNSRTGPSPNPEDMKRGTPKMAPGGMPQPGMEGMQGRGSPAPGFDPNQMNPNVPPGFQGMKMPGGMMPNGQMMPAATSHPAFNAQMNGQMTPQQMEMMRQQAGRPNGPWPQGPPPGMMQPQQPPNMTPRNSNMPPPPAPATGEGQNRTQPSSPSQANAAPPTPSQSNKPNPKGKKETGKGNKKASGKKGATTDATPASEAGDQPPTPTPAPPITPTAPQQQFKNGPQGGPPQQPGQQNVGGNQGQPDLAGGPFGGSLDGGDLGFGGMDFGNLDGQDVLDNFDFDSFLNTNDENGAFAFDANMNFGADGGLEAGGDV
ncbi:Adhesion defective protein 2 [Elsinoe australis]|uniref:Adhesion defective protein 2 n=1 Tax=Elsinoe australis TaxID=40998 RepID=A0A2P7YGD4_9PEZI|nr:Adhesion defective protein 2 [Elsinoe australis]